LTKKVIFLIGTLSGGGAERVVSNITMALPEDIQSEIILFGKESKIEYPYKGNIKYLDRLSLKSNLSKIKALISRIKIMKNIKKLNPNVPIISFLEYPNLLNILSGNKKRSIVSVRNFMSTKHKKGLKAFFWNLTIKYLYKKTVRVIVVSKGIKEDLVLNYKIPKEKIRVIYNSYPISEIEKKAGDKLTEDEQKIFKKPTVITAGRLNEQKGHIHLLNAFSKVKKSVPNSQLVFLGEGKLEASLKESAKELGIHNNVHFLGFKRNPFKYIAQSKVFVMTSYYEGFPNALAEAMACKIPVISTDCQSGPREILAPDITKGTIESKNNRFGILLPNITVYNKDKVENMIFNSIKSLIVNEKYNNDVAKKSYDRVNDFDIGRIINVWLKLINTNK